MTEISIYQAERNVPARMLPVQWDCTRGFRGNENLVEKWRGAYGEYLREGETIDEAAILVPNDFARSELHDHLRMTGWGRFNTAEDLVYTNPFGTRYLVEYHFYLHQDYDWRLEVMMMVPDRNLVYGFSPLHAALAHPQDATRPVYPIAHLSYKPVRRTFHAAPMPGDPSLPERQQSARGSYGDAVQHLKNRALLHAQTCQSTYGVFGYYLPNDASRQLYLKPRVNLRDEKEEEW